MKAIVLALALFAAAGAAQAQDAVSIQALQTRVAAAGARGDAAAIAAMYTDDATLVAQDGRRYQGREQIRGFWQATAAALSDPRITTKLVIPLAADLVQEEGAYGATTRAAPPKPVGGSYTVVWRKVGPDWLMASDIIR